MHKDLLDNGFNLSQSVLYYHLLPKNFLSASGKRHENAVPVKLSKPQNDFHKCHKDGQLSTTSIRYVESLASYLGPD